MVKLLIVGSIQGEWAVFQKKLAALHKSAHGPFDLCLCTGTFCESEEEYATVSATLDLPLPTYALDRTGLPSDEGSLPRNLHLLPSMGSVNVATLSIACMGHRMKQFAPGAFSRLAQSPEEVMHFRGYDVLVTAEWPASVSEGVEVPAELTIPPTDEAVSELACRLAPRYHFSSAPGQQHFFQRAPYTNCGTLQCTDSSCVTRFIGMAAVSANKDKTRKWIHALSLDPCATSPAPPPPSACTPCPYTVTSAASLDHPQPPLPPGASVTVTGNRKRKLEDSVAAGSAGEGAFFFGAMGVPRPGESGASRQGRRSADIQPPSPDARTLFVGGLTPQLREQDLSQGLACAVAVRMPHGKNYAFVEFDSHQAALTIVKESQSTMGVSVKGRPVSIGWATGAANGSSGDGRASVRSVGGGGAVSSTSSSLFIGGLGARAPSEGAGEDDASRGQLEASLLGLFPASVAVHLLPGKSYAFVDFRSHDAAKAVMDTYVTDNAGFVLPGAAVAGDEGATGALTVGWAQGKPSRRAPSQGREYDNAASHNADCWFCLASSTVKVHLIVSVAEAMYLSLPRGGVVDWHVLLIPIECVSTRAQLSAAAARDLVAYQAALQRLFLTRNLACLRFERALRTQGQRNHMQVHVVPLTEEQASQAITVFLALCGQHKVVFHEIPDARLSVEEFLVNLPGGPHMEYFCIEIPYGELQRSQHRRFVFVQPGEGQGPRVRFPMSFGTEAAARMIGQPERANWKHCMQSEEEETRLAEEFRKSFQQFDIAA